MGFYANQFYSSENSGENWEYANTDTPLRKVEVTDDFFELQQISYNSNFFDDEPTAYQAIEFFGS